MHRRLLAALAVTTLGLSACGSSGTDNASNAGSADDASAVTDEPSSTGEADIAGSPTVEAAAEETTEDSVADTVPLDTDFSGAGSADFCAVAQSFQDEDPTSDVFASDDPAAIEESWNELDALMATVVDAAPSEISGDFQLVSSTFGLLREAYERAGWDIMKVPDVVEADPELAAVFEGDNPDVDAAGARIDAYLEQVCGIAPG